MMRSHTGHKSLSSLRRYFRQRDPFRANACVDLGLYRVSYLKKPAFIPLGALG